MKKSKVVKLGLTSAIAMSIAGCSSDSRASQRCVDQMGRVVDEQYCRQPASGPYPYRWYYGGSGYSRGTYATGGQFSPSGAGESSGVSRGGFGATGEGHGGGE